MDATGLVAVVVAVQMDLDRWQASEALAVAMAAKVQRALLPPRIQDLAAAVQAPQLQVVLVVLAGCVFGGLNNAASPAPRPW